MSRPTASQSWTPVLDPSFGLMQQRELNGMEKKTWMAGKPRTVVTATALAALMIGGAGFALALVLMAGVREKLDLANVPELVKGTAAALIVAGILSMGFMGFAGLGR